MNENKLANDNKLIVDRAFFCDSPFEVFTSIHMVIHDGIESDIYILDSFRDASRLIDKLNENPVFRKSIIINSKNLYRKEKSLRKKSLISSAGTFTTYFNVDKIVEQYIDTNVKYKTMFFTCNQLSFRLARFYFIKKGYETEFIFFDEGSGSYDGHFERVKFSDRFFRTLLFGKKSSNRNLKFYLYQPELYCDYNNNKNRLYTIPKVDNRDLDNLDIYKNVFNVSPYSKDRKCIFFDSLREEICTSKYALDKLSEWFDLVEDAIGTDGMYVKSHPRAYGLYPHRCQEYATTSPMEINYMTMDLDNMCLVSLISTAVISPKMIYGKEPYVILLCNVDHKVYNPRPELLDFYNNIRRLYKDPSRFMIPENEGELRNCLETMGNYIKHQ